MSDPSRHCAGGKFQVAKPRFETVPRVVSPLPVGRETPVCRGGSYSVRCLVAWSQLSLPASIVKVAVVAVAVAVAVVVAAAAVDSAPIVALVR